MQYVRLGRTGLKVSKLCVGTNMFGAGYVDDSQALAVIDAAYEQGVNFIDTADMYNGGLSEHVVGKAVKTKRNDFIVATKCFAPTGPGPNDRGLSRKHLIDSVEASLRRLDTDYIDLLQVHYWDPETPLEESLRTLDDLVRAGKIRYIGCSNFSAWQLCKSLWVSDKNGYVRFETVQPEYNFARREIEEELFPLCEDQEVGILPYQLLMGGVLTGKYDRNEEPSSQTHMGFHHAQRARNTYWNDRNFDMVEKLEELSLELGCQITQLVIAAILSKSVITSVIVGSSRPDQLRSNVEALELTVPDNVLRQINDL